MDTKYITETMVVCSDYDRLILTSNVSTDDISLAARILIAEIKNKTTE